jgi:hypothetical protein
VHFISPRLRKSLHKHAYPRPRRSHHLGEFFVENLQFDANAARIFLAPCAGQLQQRLPNR